MSPYHRRLDWCLWIAALGPRRFSAWFPRLLLKLVDNDPQVGLTLASEAVAQCTLDDDHVTGTVCLLPCPKLLWYACEFFDTVYDEIVFARGQYTFSFLVCVEIPAITHGKPINAAKF